MTQHIIIALLCLGALAYLTRTLYRHFSQPGCGDHCNACSKIDFKEIEKKANARSEKP